MQQFPVCATPVLPAPPPPTKNKTTSCLSLEAPVVLPPSDASCRRHRKGATSIRTGTAARTSTGTACKSRPPATTRQPQAEEDPGPPRRELGRCRRLLRRKSPTSWQRVQEEDQAGTSETKPEQQRPSRNNLEPTWLRVEGPSSKSKVCLQVEAPTKNQHGNVSNNSGPSSDFAKLNCGLRPQRCVGRPANLKTLKVPPIFQLELVGSFICDDCVSGPNSQL